MDGIRLNDLESLEAYGVDKQKIVEEITRAYAHQIYIDGFFNGDPHPGILCISLCVYMVVPVYVFMYNIFHFFVEIL
jgi:predicted unusual protein kinase regulating ubiquinone biosynthesis (AarF/ABC1/UbiB family)